MKNKMSLVSLLAVAGLALTACTPSTSDTAGLNETPKIGEVIHFSGSSTPAGWTAQNTGGTGINATVDAEHPAPYTKGNCYFSQSVEYLPKAYENRGDDYNTHQFLYDMAQAFKISNPDLQELTANTENGKLTLISSSINYDDPSSGKTTTRVAARAISAVKKSGYEVQNPPENPYVKNAGEGVPVVFLKADCVKGETVSDEEWKSLIDSTKISLSSPVPSATETPAINTGPFSPAPSPLTGSESAPPTSTEASTTNPSETGK